MRCEDFNDWDDTLCPMRLMRQIKLGKAQGKLGKVYCPKIGTHYCPILTMVKRWNDGI